MGVVQRNQAETQTPTGVSQERRHAQVPSGDVKPVGKIHICVGCLLFYNHFLSTCFVPTDKMSNTLFEEAGLITTNTTGHRLLLGRRAQSDLVGKNN